VRIRETREGVTRPLIIATLMRAEGDTGVQTHVRTVMEALRSETGPVELITPYSAPRWQVYPIFALRRIIDPLWKTASVCWYRYWHATFVHMMLHRRLASGEACTVYAQCPLSAHAALRARVNRAQRVVMVVHFNVSQADEWASKGMIKHDGVIAERIRAFEARVLPQLDGIIHVSNFMAQALQRRVPAIAEVASAIVPNFIVDPGPRADRPLERDLLCIGTLEPRKNQRYAIEILAAAKRLGTQFKLTLVGDGPDHGALKAVARDLGVATQVYFAGRVADGAVLFEHHRACLHVAKIENLPLTLIEALSRAKPIFATSTGGVSELFEDGVEGRYLPLEDAAAAATLILKGFRDAAWLACAGVSARSRFISRFESRIVSRHLSQFLQL
jgi:glycosyltransferase involved in cell wall biosynthesis